MLRIGGDRKVAHEKARMKRALEETIIEGVKTTIPFHLKVLDNAFYKRGAVYTNFIEKRMLNDNDN